MTQIQLRRATAASWTSVNPILALGEVGLETDTYKLKVGDGTSQWSSLGYYVPAWSDITGKPTVTATPTAAAIALWDSSKNLSANATIDGFTTTATAAGTTTLTVASTKIQEFTGSANQTLVLPTTGIVAGQQFIVINNSTGTITTNSSNGSQIHVLGPGVECVFTALVATPTLPAHWEDSFYGATFAAGKVLTVNSTITLAGTDGTTMTFPGASDTVATIAATQAFTNKDLSSGTNTFPTSLVTLTGSQSLSNKTLAAPTVTDYTETVNAIGTVSSSSTLSLSSGTVLTATLTASTACTFTMPTAVAGKSFTLMLKQPSSTGGGTATFTNVKWGTSGAPTITSGAGKMDILTFFSDGTNWYGSAAQGFTY